ncbi:MAG: TonB-dependent receptor family protein [Flavobacteriales bacterium]|nr:TonB-dependent receptor family protein [Flavobacteriales bacterium]
MKIILFILSICISVFSIAQSAQGFVIDEEGNPLPYATLQLFKSDSTVQKVETTRGDGSFRFTHLTENNYRLVISFIGYANTTRLIDLEKDKGVLGKLSMKASATKLGEVTIAAEKPMIQVEPDKTIFNVSKNLSTIGDNGVELLRKAPGLQVDNDDNIILEGKSGVTVYINGKQSFLQGTDLTNYLKSIRAEEIESIEIITQPSSKYDAAGTGGILNIILKREKGLGTKGSITNTFTYGDFGRNNTTLNLNHRSKNYALFGTYSHFQGKRTGFFDMLRLQGSNVFDGETESVADMENDRLNIGGDYYLDTKNTLSFALGGNLNRRYGESTSITPISQINSEVDSVLRAPNEEENEVLNLNANVNYTYQDTNGRRLSVDFDGVIYNQDKKSLQPNIYDSPSGVELSRNVNFQKTPIDITVLSGKIDYEQKLWKGVLLVGTKVSNVLTDNVFDFYEVENGINSLDSSRSNTFDYQETIIAGYLNYKYKYKKWNFQAGLRGEQTESEGNLESFTSNTDKSVKRDYFNLFPSGGITYEVNRNNTAALTYSKRIQRPNYQNLNPFESQINELSFRKGNPFLQPQFTDNIKLSNIYKYTLNTSFTYSYISDFFAEVTEAEGDRVSFINTRNVADQQVYNFSVSYPFKLREWWNVYASTYLYYTQFTANHPDFIPTNRTVYGGFAQNTFTLPKDFKFEVSGWYSGPSIWRGTFKTKSIGSLNLAIQKRWKDWTGKLSFNDVLYTSPWRAENKFGDLFLTGTGGGDSRNISFFLSYTFGQSDVKEKRRRNSGAEDEKNRIN